MDRQAYIKKYNKKLRQGFDNFFNEHILHGRPQLVADIAVRTYPYVDLVDAYSAGVATVIQIIEEEKDDD